MNTKLNFMFPFCLLLCCLTWQGAMGQNPPQVTPPTGVPLAGLMAYYPFDGNTGNILSLINPATIAPNNVNTNGCGVLGNGLIVDGADQTGANSRFNNTNPAASFPGVATTTVSGFNDFSMGYWFLTDNQNGPYSLIGKRITCVSAIPILDMRANSGTGRINCEAVSATGGNPDINNNVSSTGIVSGCWNHVMVTREVMIDSIVMDTITPDSIVIDTFRSCNIRLYLNGGQIDAILGSDVVNLPINVLTLSGSQCINVDLTNDFIGRFDEFMVYNRAITAAEVSNIQDAYIPELTTPTSGTIIDPHCPGDPITTIVDMKDVDPSTTCFTPEWTSNGILTFQGQVEPIPNPRVSTSYVFYPTLDGEDLLTCRPQTFDVIVREIDIDGDRSICLGETVVLTANIPTSITAVSFLWEERQNGNWVTVGSANTITVSPTINTRYRLTIVASDGCTYRRVRRVRVREMNLALAATTPTTICEGQPVNLQANVTFAGAGNLNPGVIFQWTPSLSTTNTLNDNPTSSTTYSVVATDGTNFGCTASGQLAITVNPKPTVSINGPSVACSGTDITLTATSLPGATYEWSPNISSTSSTVTTTAAALSLPNTVTYYVTITDANGCQAIDSFPVLIKDCCWAALTPDYINLDPDFPDSRLADYGIVQVGTSNTFRINNGNYNRLPERMSFADNVTLQIQNGSTADITNSDLVFGEGAGILLGGSGTNGKIIASNAVLRPCDDTETWDGVRIEGTNTTDADFKECTFINATIALLYQRSAVGSIFDNSFQNCQYSIVIRQATLPDDITNNIIRVDDHARTLTYSLLDNINGTSALGMPNFAGRSNSMFNYTSPTVSDYIDFAGIQIIGTNGFVSPTDNSTISHNTFVNAMELGDGTLNARQFNGLHIWGKRGLNISQNTFTNNNKSIICEIPQDVSIENNYIETTRRALNNELNYQILAIGQGAARRSSVLIHNNTLVNSDDPTGVDAFASPQTPSFFLEGSGAIYLSSLNRRDTANFVGSEITNNTIHGYRIGIYTTDNEQANIYGRIANNDIKCHVYGIYIDQPGVLGPLLGCNTIDMDLDHPNSTTAVGPVGICVNDGNSRTRVVGNCISNTATALWYRGGIPAANQELPRIPKTYNNYLYNYTDAGALIDNYRGFLMLDDAADAAIVNPVDVGRNAFISNILTGVDINYTYSGPLTRSIDARYNYHGEDNNLAKLGNVLTINNDNTYRPFTTCGNMEAGAPLTVNEIAANVMYLCDDQNVYDPRGTGSILQRTSQNNDIGLVNNLQDALDELYENEVENFVGTIINALTALSNTTDANTLYQAIQDFDLDDNSSNWIDFEYHKLMNNYAAAKTVLSGINSDQEDEQAQVVVEMSRLNMLSNNLTTVSNQDDIDNLKKVADGNGLYMHTAREMLSESIGGYNFRYRAVPLPVRTARKDATLSDLTNNSMAVYPNPTNSDLFVEILELGDKKWLNAKIHDVHGRLLLDQAINSNVLSFDVQKFAAGVYFISLHTEDGQEAVAKFVKQ